MALVLGMNLNGDNKIYLNDLLVTVDNIVDKSRATITVHNACIDEQKVLNDQHYVQVTQNTKMMLSSNDTTVDFCRVLIDAPKSVKILRGKLKEVS